MNASGSADDRQPRSCAVGVRHRRMPTRQAPSSQTHGRQATVHHVLSSRRQRRVSADHRVEGRNWRCAGRGWRRDERSIDRQGQRDSAGRRARVHDGTQGCCARCGAVGSLGVATGCMLGTAHRHCTARQWCDTKKVHALAKLGPRPARMRRSSAARRGMFDSKLPIA